MSENTAIRALQFNEVYDDTLDLIFIDEEHRDFFLLTLGRMKNVDERHLAFAYCLGISEKARERAELFCCVYAKFFWEAVKLRYPGFCR